MNKDNATQSDVDRTLKEIAVHERDLNVIKIKVSESYNQKKRDANHADLIARYKELGGLLANRFWKIGKNFQPDLRYEELDVLLNEGTLAECEKLVEKSTSTKMQYFGILIASWSITFVWPILTICYVTHNPYFFIASLVLWVIFVTWNLIKYLDGENGWISEACRNNEMLWLSRTFLTLKKELGSPPRICISDYKDAFDREYYLYIIRDACS